MKPVETAMGATAAGPLARAAWASAVRGAWGLGVLGPLGVLGVAASLTPDPAGHGTHTQLGLPPCGFLAWCGLPCPGCGLTTSFAHMVRLEVVAAAEANLFGVFLFVAMVLVVPFSLHAWRRGATLVDALLDVHAEKICTALCVLAFVSWGVRVALSAGGAG